MNIKLSPLSFFLILLLVLLVSYFIRDWFPSSSSVSSNTKENFIGFDYGASAGSSITIPQYSGTSTVNKVAKVYDNVFYDVYNGNLIEVDGTAYSGTSEITGSTISNIYILGRANGGSPLVSYKTQTTNQIVQTTESQNTFTNSFKEYIYKTQCLTTNPYVVFYLPWNDSTYIHIIDISGGIQNHKHIVTELYHATSQNTITYSNSTLKFSSGKSMDDFNASNNNFVRLPSYDPSYSIFQMSTNIFFDVRNAQVIIVNPDTNAIKVYPRKYDMTDSSLIKSGNYTAQTSVVSTDFNTWTTYDLANKGNKMVLYISVATKTMLVIIEPDNSTGYRIFNIKRFIDTGLDTGTPSVSLTSSSNTNTYPSDPKSMMNDYYIWFYNTVAKGIQDPNSHNYNYSDNYILKTQIVPPVCPSCPVCPNYTGNSGTCTNCGGNGGSGILGIKGEPVTNTVNATTGTIDNAVDNTAALTNNALNTTGNLLYAGASGSKNLAEDTVSGASNLAQNTASGASNLAQRTGSGVKDFVENTGSGVGNLLYAGASGTKNFVENTGSGAINLAKNIGNGITNLNNPTTIENNNRNFNDNDINRLGYYNSSGGPIIDQSSVTDPYSYFGAVPSKPSKFMPVTSDFSKFGR